MNVLTDDERRIILARSWPTTPYMGDAAFIPALVELESTGTYFDPTGLDELALELGEQKALALGAIRSFAGWPVNLNAPHQVAKLLFDQIGLKPRRIKRGTGHRSTDKEVLADLDHFIVDLIEDYRQADKLESTYVKILPLNAAAHGGRIITPYNNTSVETGRLSSGGKKKGGPTALNVQNIPRRTDIGRRLRRHFAASPGNQLVAVDASQFQLRVAAVDSGEPTMIAAFHSGMDYHDATALDLFQEVTKQFRDVAKTINYGLLFGAREAKMVHTISALLGNVDRESAASVYRGYFAKRPTLAARIRAVHDFCRANGYVQDWFGRRAYYDTSGPRWALEKVLRECYAMLMQGPEAFVAKLFTTMILRHRDREQLPARAVLHCHDEAVFDTLGDAVSRLREIIQLVEEEINELLDWPVPIVLDIGVGPNWAEAH